MNMLASLATTASLVLLSANAVAGDPLPVDMVRSPSDAHWISAGPLTDDPASVPRVERRASPGLIAAGAGIFAAAHFPTLYMAAASGNASTWLFAIPVFGPLVAGSVGLVATASNGGGDLGGLLMFASLVALGDGLVQGAGLAMMIAGSIPRPVRSPSRAPQFAFALVGPAGTPGLTLGVANF